MGRLTAPVSLALQGGGSHGAFTWGVLERLLEDGRLRLAGLSGASAGAVNAALLAHGLTTGGPDEARVVLRRFWESVAQRVSPPVEAFLFLTGFYSPAQLNPYQINPLRELLEALIDFERLRAHCRLPIFIAATRVDSGRLRLFGTRELTLDALLASACLPQLHVPVEVDGVAYWDGGLAANPPIRPLLYKCAADDILMVLLNPNRRSEIPRTAGDIRSRLTELAFSSPLHSELEGIALAKRAAEATPVALGPLERRLRRLRLHVIAPDEVMEQLAPESKLDTRADFIHCLFDRGRRAANAWLEEGFAALGRRSSFPLDEHAY
jgi:NTE family protein